MKKFVKSSVLNKREIKKLEIECKRYVDGGAPLWIKFMDFCCEHEFDYEWIAQNIVGNRFDSSESNQIKRWLK